MTWYYFQSPHDLCLSDLFGNEKLRFHRSWIRLTIFFAMPSSLQVKVVLVVHAEISVPRSPALEPAISAWLLELELDAWLLMSSRDVVLESRTWTRVPFFGTWTWDLWTWHIRTWTWVFLPQWKHTDFQGIFKFSPNFSIVNSKSSSSKSWPLQPFL